MPPVRAGGGDSEGAGRIFCRAGEPRNLRYPCSKLALDSSLSFVILRYFFGIRIAVRSWSHRLSRGNPAGQVNEANRGVPVRIRAEQAGAERTPRRPAQANGCSMANSTSEAGSPQE